MSRTLGLSLAATVFIFAGFLAMPPRAKGADPLAGGARLAGQRVKNLRLPIKEYEDIGMVKELMLADAAKVDEKGVIHAKGNLRLISFDRDGGTNGIARAEMGFFDKDAQFAQCQGPVSIEWKDILLTGNGLTWDSSNTVLRVESDAVLTLNRGGRSAVDALEK